MLEIQNNKNFKQTSTTKISYQTQIIVTFNEIQLEKFILIIIHYQERGSQMSSDSIHTMVCKIKPFCIKRRPCTKNEPSQFIN